VAAEPVTDVDITAADILTDLHAELSKSGIELCFAEMKGPVNLLTTDRVCARIES